MRRPTRYKRALPRYARSSHCRVLLNYPGTRALCLGCVVTHYGDKEIGDARAAYLAQRFELVPVDAIEQQNAASKNRSLMHRFEGACGVEVLGIHHHFEVTRVEF